MDAALGASGAVPESELRIANAEVILWALHEEVEPAPIDVANRWVVEYVWRVWITEAGPIIHQAATDGQDSLRLEQEMRAALESLVVARGLPSDRPLTATDFEHVIQSALDSLGRISGVER